MSDKMIERELVNFVRESRKRGFSDEEIKEKLVEKEWGYNEIDSAFDVVEKTTPKVRLCADIDEDVAKMIVRRAKKNMMSVEEQVEDILRRSCVSMRRKPIGEGKVDDTLVNIFSRRRYMKEKQ